MKTAEERNRKTLSNFCTNYANGCWYNNQELNFNVDKAIELEDAIWNWIKETVITEHDGEIISKIDEMIGEYKKDQKELINYGNDGIIIDYQIIALTELKQFIEGIK